MSESSAHVALVAAIVSWIDNYTEISRTMAVLVDQPQVRDCIPPNINGNIPDVFASSSTDNFALIGEAKTVTDIESRHSRRQLVAYLTFLAKFKNLIII